MPDLGGRAVAVGGDLSDPNSAAGLFDAHHLGPRLAPERITVNALAPALIAETAMLPGSSDELERLVPVRRLGRPPQVADLAPAVLANPYVTNQVFGIDGGMFPH